MNPTTKRVLRALATGAASTLIGLTTVTLLGCIALPIVHGVQGLLIGMSSGGLTALIIRRRTTWPASVIAGTIGSFIASYGTLAMGEMFPLGSLTWAIQGGAYGAAFGVPIGSFFGLLALLQTPKRST